MNTDHTDAAVTGRRHEERAAQPAHNISRFIAVGLIFAALPGEVSNQILVHRSVHAFCVTMANYVWFLALAYAVSRRRERPPLFAARLTYWLLYGTVGLLIEWFVLGVYPMQPSLVQLMMFSFWAGMATVPCIFTDEPVTPGLARVRAGLARYIAGWAGVSLLPFTIVQLFLARAADPLRGFSMLVFGLGIFGVDCYVYRYLRMLRSGDMSAGAATASPAIEA